MIRRIIGWLVAAASKAARCQTSQGNVANCTAALDQVLLHANESQLSDSNLQQTEVDVSNEKQSAEPNSSNDMD